MGKRYYCEYCDNTMVDSPNIIKTHRSGLNHQRMAKEHYNRHRDARTILEEEKGKKPCFRFLQNGSCTFGGLCRFTHYSADQLESLQLFVSSNNPKDKALVDDNSLLSWYDRRTTENANSTDRIRDSDTSILSEKGHLVVCPWTYPAVLEPAQTMLPPSVQKLNFDDFRNAEFADWG